LFNKFINKVAITAELLAVSSLYIGAGQDSYSPTAINGEFLKDPFGRVYIPGSSLKGVLRAFLSSVQDEESRIHKFGLDTKAGRIEYLKGKRNSQGGQGRDMLGGALADGEFFAKCLSSDSTMAERLFGSQVMAGKVRIADAVLPFGAKARTDIRNGVSIDRDTHTAVDGALFDTETVPAGTRFIFRASAENLKTSADMQCKDKDKSMGMSEAECFAALVDYFAKGNIPVGGRSRAGLGHVELENIKVFVWKRSAGGFPTEQLIDGLDMLEATLSEGDGAGNV
jgi:CRISPR-associated RAMP protein (TIGR02581 family)